MIRLLAALVMFCLMPSDALAHASDRGFVLLLPTGHYIAGGAFAVAVSFLALVLLKPDTLQLVAAKRLPLFRLRFDPRFATSALSFAVLVLLVTAGLFGSRDPLSNPLPLTIWTLFWVGLTLASGVFGNLFRLFDPWYAVVRLFGGRPEGGRWTNETVSTNSGSTYLPAIIQFAAFAWFELVYPAPDDPFRLALVVTAYWAINFVAMLIVGHDRWTRTGECFSVFFRVISQLSIVETNRDENGFRVSLCLPGARLMAATPLPMWGVFFVLMALASVSFDGLMRTFWWLGHIGVNPLEFPGRSAVMMENTAGLVLAISLLTSAFMFCVWLGERLSGDRVQLARAAGLLVWSIVPISLAYHFAHYLVALLINGQYALVALSDPLSRGWNLFGTADHHVTAGLVMGPDAAWVLWNLQAGVIVLGHVLAVVIAHLLAARLHPDPRRAMRSQIPLTVLMVAYTVLGLWLLSTATGA